MVDLTTHAISGLCLDDVIMLIYGGTTFSGLLRNFEYKFPDKLFG